VISDFSDLC